MCNVRGLNNPVKQDDVICWHKDMNNLVSIFMESKLKGRVCPWLASKFDGVWVFTSDLDFGSLGASVMIVMNFFLAKHICKVSKVPGWLLSIKLLFKNKLSVFILGLYAGTGKINSLIAKIVNKSFFVILGGNFNEDGSWKCASFKKCLELGLVNFLIGSMVVKMPTWANSRGVMKTINYVFVSLNLVNSLVHCGVLDVGNYFDTDHQAVSVSLGLGGLLNTHLFSFRKQANKNHWKFNVKNASEAKWLEFKNAMAVNAAMFSDVFSDTVKDVICKILVLSAGGTFKKRWFKSFDTVHNRVLFRFYMLELLVSKLVKASCLSSSDNLDSADVLLVKSMFYSGAKFDNIHSALAKAKRLYHFSKLLKSKCAEESHIRQAINNRMESFELDKSHTIRIISKIDVDELLCVVSSLLDRKAASLSGISNELWKHCDKSVLGLLLVLLNSCLSCELVPGPWKEAWVLMIPKSYEWEGVFMNTYPIALIETARKILSKILSDRISLACSSYDVLYGDNFSVLKGKTTQSPIFAVGSVIEDALEKNQELWLVLKFVHFFGSIHKDRTNYVMTDFGLTDGYQVFDGLDQGEAGLSSFFAVSAFIDDTIWVGGSQAAIQHILDIASEFFRVNDILINNDKTLAISINCRVGVPSLFISGSPISVVCKRESHQYLGIFLSTEGLSKLSLAKTHLDVHFFTNLVLRKAVSDKQFLYLVLALGYIFVGVYNKWDALIRRGLKLKTGLPLDFSNDTIYHPAFYGLKLFSQCQSESKVASLISFVNSGGILECLFGHRSYDLQILVSNNFLAGMIRILLDCNLSLGGSLTSAFWFYDGVPMSIKRLDPHGPVPDWFGLSVVFLVAFHSSSAVLVGAGLLNFCESDNFVSAHNRLPQVNINSLSVYTDGSLRNLGTVDCRARAAVFFENIDLGVDVGVQGLVSSTLAELQAIALALECMPAACSVNLFSDSQAALDACKSELSLVCPDFRNQCWVECWHIQNVIHSKNLRVSWHKVKGHSGISGNDYANSIADAASLSGWYLPPCVDGHFLLADSGVVSGNSRHFVQDVCHVCWEVGSGSGFLASSFSSRVWHPDLHMAIGFTSRLTADTRTYLMKALHCQLSVAVRRHIYNKCYLSVLCLYCDKVEVFDHLSLSGLFLSSSVVLQLMSICTPDLLVFLALYKGFVFNGWLQEAVAVFYDPKIAGVKITDFVHSICFTFRNNIWLVCAKHHVFMEKNGLIPVNGSFVIPVSGLVLRFLAGVVKLLGITKAFGILFGFHKSCSFFLGISDLVSVNIVV
ncbi:hypothetical protein G9A89_015220 [Geosiphon pyriformis]|nr:hypothetical protein G9A89_015220 [Geosiphon pyriformis]